MLSATSSASRILITTLGLWLALWVGQSTAAISILTPASQTTWFTNNTVTTKWTSSTSSGDPAHFRILLGSPADEGFLNRKNATLADQVPTANDQLTILLPRVTFASGYVLYFVNGSNVNQVYAESQPFEIAQGISPTTSVKSGLASASTSIKSSTVNIPGPVTSLPPASASTAASSTSTPISAALSTYLNPGSAAFAMIGVVSSIIMCSF